MKKITKRYIRGSNYPVYIGNGVVSTSLDKVRRFVSPQSGAVKAILSAL